jgi:hypothetical protein
VGGDISLSSSYSHWSLADDEITLNVFPRSASRMFTILLGGGVEHWVFFLMLWRAQPLDEDAWCAGQNVEGKGDSRLLNTNGRKKMNKVVGKIISISLPMLFVIGFINATYGAEKLGTDPSIWPTIVYYIKKIIAVGVPLLFIIGFIDAARGVYTGMYGLSADQVAAKLRVEPLLWRVVGHINVVHVISWTAILIGVLLGKLTLAFYITIFAFGMFVTDMVLALPMWKFYPMPRDFIWKATSTTLTQFAYLLFLGWLMAAA